jgi:hypothetical protein
LANQIIFIDKRIIMIRILIILQISTGL